MQDIIVSYPEQIRLSGECPRCGRKMAFAKVKHPDALWTQVPYIVIEFRCICGHTIDVVITCDTAGYYLDIRSNWATNTSWGFG